MTVAIEKTVREWALESSSAPAVFEKLGIDYCCGGNISLEQACRKANLDIDAVLDSLEKAKAARTTGTKQDWQREPLTELIAHIQNTHHVYTRDEIARLVPLCEKVSSVHGKNHPELLRIYELFQQLAQELISHMRKEEMILFPYVRTIEVARMGDISIPSAPFGSVQNPIAMMEHEHDLAGKCLRAMREASNGYAAPADACVSFQTLYRSLAEFEADLHQHIHLENNVLFPRAVAMESAR